MSIHPWGVELQSARKVEVDKLFYPDGARLTFVEQDRDPPCLPSHPRCFFQDVCGGVPAADVASGRTAAQSTVLGQLYEAPARVKVWNDEGTASIRRPLDAKKAPYEGVYEDDELASSDSEVRPTSDVTPGPPANISTMYHEVLQSLASRRAATEAALRQQQEAEIEKIAKEISRCEELLMEMRKREEANAAAKLERQQKMRLEAEEQTKAASAPLALESPIDNPPPSADSTPAIPSPPKLEAFSDNMTAAEIEETLKRRLRTDAIQKLDEQVEMAEQFSKNKAVTDVKTMIGKKLIAAGNQASSSSGVLALSREVIQLVRTLPDEMAISYTCLKTTDILTKKLQDDNNISKTPIFLWAYAHIMTSLFTTRKDLGRYLSCFLVKHCPLMLPAAPRSDITESELKMQIGYMRTRMIMSVWMDDIQSVWTALSGMLNKKHELLPVLPFMLLPTLEETGFLLYRGYKEAFIASVRVISEEILPAMATATPINPGCAAAYQAMVSRVRITIDEWQKTGPQPPKGYKEIAG
ncbi:MAG: uncharacterized protein KVP18_004101 [Porospora cf. gigantea A]|uniref:uncharacterized protein n=1 Tax=Porospora cf. gigantea A TaxID=2853593 RepID=UPI00355A8924|nr:MAG: hypothetical protein KVP18_004101 [Porospora cf. gigantea A]